MSRYFFHLAKVQQLIHDSEGVEVAGSDAERLGSIVAEIRSENPELFEADGDWSIEVVDEAGHKVGSFPLRS